MSNPQQRAVVIVGGELTTTPLVGPTDLVIAADSGYDHAVALGISVQLLVGDLDSISTNGLAEARSLGVPIEQHPPDKDATDLELAVGAALGRGATSIDIYGGEGGRLGHLVGVALALTSTEWSSTEIAWHTGNAVVRAATPGKPVRFSTDVSDTVTLLPIGTAAGISTSGLRWELTNGTLERGSSRGVSNESIADQVNVDVLDGAVLVIQEGRIAQ